MKKLLLPFLGVLLIISCNNKPSVNIITVTDNGATYTDTFSQIMGFEGGTIAPSEDAQGKPDITTEGTGTGRFAKKIVKIHPTPSDTLDYYCDIIKTGNTSIFTLTINSSPAFPIFLTIAGAIGPANGIGTYREKSGPTSQMAGSASRDTVDISELTSAFKESFNGGQKYSVDSAVVNITESSSKPGRGNAIKGNYQMWVSNTSGIKKVSGIIDCKTGYKTR